VSDDKQFDPNKLNQELHDQIHRNIHDEIRDKIRERKDRRRRRGPIVVGIHLGNRSYGSGLMWGAVLIFIGLIFLLDHLGFVSAEHLWRFWPLLLVLAGVVNVVAPERRFWGIILLAAGVLLQLNELNIAHFGWGDFWPIVLIAVGLMVIWNSLVSRRIANPAPSEGDDPQGTVGSFASSKGGDPRTTVTGAAVFSGLERRITTQDFQGGSVTAIFGGIELDLSDANMQADEATLEVNAIFGGAEIRVPDSWQVSYCGAPIFGGVEDKTRIRTADGAAGTKPKVLMISGTVIFGGLEIKN